MNNTLNISLADGYKSMSQKARVVTEGWVLKEVYCPCCGGLVSAYENNKPVADFCCKKCIEDFELKSKKGKVGNKVSAGAHSQMVKRINSSQRPNFFFMGYLPGWKVNDFFVVPKHFFVSGIIEKRKPLASSAQRAGWVGSNILFSRIPKAGRIYYVENGKEVKKVEVLRKWKKTVFLKKITKAEARGWILDTMNCIDALGKNEFALADVYAFVPELKEIHPENQNIKAKLRQQLQLLRDKNYLKFLGRGIYRLI